MMERGKLDGRLAVPFAADTTTRVDLTVLTADTADAGRTALRQRLPNTDVATHDLRAFSVRINPCVHPGSAN
jgi:hypothetical protein